MAQNLQIPSFDLDDPHILVIRAGLINNREIDDPNDTIIKVIRPKAGNIEQSTTRREAAALSAQLSRSGWQIDDSVSPGGLWNARPPKGEQL